MLQGAQGDLLWVLLQEPASRRSRVDPQGCSCSNCTAGCCPIESMRAAAGMLGASKQSRLGDLQGCCKTTSLQPADTSGNATQSQRSWPIFSCRPPDCCWPWPLKAWHTQAICSRAFPKSGLEADLLLHLSLLLLEIGIIGPLPHGLTHMSPQPAVKQGGQGHAHLT